MKTAIFAAALLVGGAAFAQDYGTKTDTTHATHTPTMATESLSLPRVVQPDNSNPERDARGILVISDPAVVPPGFNGVPVGEAMGGPIVDPATGETIDPAPDSYPACTREITDNCLQTYERGRSRD